jgi:predicted ATPase
LEAIVHLRKGIEVLKALPSAAERTHQELGLQVALGNALLAIKGYAAPEVEQTYARAHALCQEIGLTAQVFPVLYGLWVFYFIRAELAKAREIGIEFLELSGKQEESAPVLMAHRVLQFALLWLGEISSSQTHFEQCTGLYDPKQHRSLAFQYGQDPGMATLSLAPWSLWLLGYPDQAMKRSQEALLAAQKTSHPLSLAYAHVMAAGFHQLRREERQVQEKAEAAIAVCSQHGFPYWLAWANILRGWALVKQRETNEGIVLIRRGMADYRATGSMLEWTGFCALLAESHLQAEQIKEGLSALDEGFTVLEKTGERFCQAELYRLKGELLLQSKNGSSGAGVHKQVQECFETALQIARRQSAKSFELRAAMSLSRLAKRQEKIEHIPCVLKEAFQWFQEGFDTPDLQEAKTLITEIT